jgi:hypothetical protein
MCREGLQFGNASAGLATAHCKTDTEHSRWLCNIGTWFMLASRHDQTSCTHCVCEVAMLKMPDSLQAPTHCPDNMRTLPTPILNNTQNQAKPLQQHHNSNQTDSNILPITKLQSTRCQDHMTAAGPQDSEPCSDTRTRLATTCTATPNLHEAAQHKG